MSERISRRSRPASGPADGGLSRAAFSSAAFSRVLFLGDLQRLLPVVGQPIGQGEERPPVGGDQRFERLGAAG
jgi:hypothetical protein